ncbi:unnamed protein product, partial [Amoebophrya sp. A25]|eukprot:GSA25T00007818001.1
MLTRLDKANTTPLRFSWLFEHLGHKRFQPTNNWTIKAIEDLETDEMCDLELKTHAALLDFCSNRAAKTYDEARTTENIFRLADGAPGSASAFAGNTPEQVAEYINRETPHTLFLILTQQKQR